MEPKCSMSVSACQTSVTSQRYITNKISRNGDRHLYCDPLIQSIPGEQRVCGFYCTVFHHGRDNSRVCKSCTTVGHKTGDPACPAFPEEGSILTFSGYQHVLSNCYMTNISAFDMDVPSRV